MGENQVIHHGSDYINVGTGDDLSIRELADIVRELIYPEAQLVFDSSKPDGMPRTWLDVSRLHAMGWHHAIGLRQGVAETYAWFLDHHQDARLSSEQPAAVGQSAASLTGWSGRP